MAQTNQNIYQKMLQATEKINRVAKNLKVELNKTSSYKAVGEADILEAVKPIESELGIYSYPHHRTIIKEEEFITTTQYGNKSTLFLRMETTYRFVNVDNPTEFIDIKAYGDGTDTQDKAPGKAMTYSDKYALMKAYKIITGDDPDQFGSQEMAKKTPPKAPPKATPPQKNSYAMVENDDMPDAFKTPEEIEAEREAEALKTAPLTNLHKTAFEELCKAKGVKSNYDLETMNFGEYAKLVKQLDAMPDKKTSQSNLDLGGK